MTDLEERLPDDTLPEWPIMTGLLDPPEGVQVGEFWIWLGLAKDRRSVLHARRQVSGMVIIGGSRPDDPETYSAEEVEFFATWLLEAAQEMRRNQPSTEEGKTE